MQAIHQGFRFALDPTARQRQALTSHCGAARFAFNWGLRQVQAARHLRWIEEEMDLPRTPSFGWSMYSLRRRWNAHKDVEAPWWPENSKEAYASGLAALAQALANWNASRQGRRAGPRMRFPRFRKRAHRMGCRFTVQPIRVDDDRHVTLPRIGRLRTAEATTGLRQRLAMGTARILSAAISCKAGRWYVSFGCEVERVVPESNGHGDTIGVDLGILTLATLSTGEVIPGPRALRGGLRKLRRLSRRQKRCQKGSANGRKATERLARHHARIAHVRQDHLHKLTTMLAKSHGRIVIEDLNVAGMIRSARGTVATPGRNVRAKSGLSRSLADAGFGEFRRQLGYKCRWYGAKLVIAERFLPSSKTCSRCGMIRDHLSLRERVFHCPTCGLHIDRDLNAAINLAGWAHPAVAVSAPETENACPRGGKTGLSPARPVDAGTGIVPEPGPSPPSSATAHIRPGRSPGRRAEAPSAWRATFVARDASRMGIVGCPRGPVSGDLPQKFLAALASGCRALGARKLV
jgi:putative transposase